MNQMFINDELKKNFFVKKWTSGVGSNGRNGSVTFLARKATCFCKVHWRYLFGIVRGLKLDNKSKGAKIIKFLIFNLDFSYPPITMKL